jgi:8-oxo-dGTP diphosphatase
MAQFSEKLNRALSHGIRLVQLRVPGWTPAFYKRAAEVAMEMCHLHGARLMLNGAADLLKTVCAHGVHLPSRELVRHSVRPISESFWLAASCHSEEELQRAKRIGVNFVVLSPVCVTATHPLASPLGWERFKALAEGLGMPVYALGGLGIKDVQTAIHHGGQGVAAIRAFWPEDEEPQRGAS